jgi:hypothetical protein
VTPPYGIAPREQVPQLHLPFVVLPAHIYVADAGLAKGPGIQQVGGGVLRVTVPPRSLVSSTPTANMTSFASWQTRHVNHVFARYLRSAA